MPTIGTGDSGGNINSAFQQVKAGHVVPAKLRGYVVITLYEHDDAANGNGDTDRVMQSLWLKRPKNGYPVYTCPYSADSYCTPPPTRGSTSKR